MFETYRPTYIAYKWPLAASCMTTPMIARIDAVIRAIFRPHLSATGEAMSAPKKHPACSVDTIFPEVGFSYFVQVLQAILTR